MLVAACALACLTPARGYADTTATPEAEFVAPSERAPANGAAALFQRGKIHYDLGEYEQAVVLFRQAYEIEPASGTLFAIAQAYRLGGNCLRALETYRSYLRLGTSQAHLDLARDHIAALEPCPAVKPAPSGPPVVETTMVPQVVAPSPPPVPVTAPTHDVSLTEQVPEGDGVRPTLRVAGWTTLAAGALAGALAGGLHLWNGGRQDDWATQDRWLEQNWMGLPLSEAAQMVAANDELARDVERTQDVTIAIVVGGVALVATAAVLLYLGSR